MRNPLDVVRVLAGGNPWDRWLMLRCWPARPTDVIAQVERTGFSGHAYRDAAPDLRKNLPSDDWATKYFLRYIEHEVTYIRYFPIALDFGALEEFAALGIRDAAFKAGVIRNLLQAQIDSDQGARESEGFWRGALSVACRVGAPLIVAGDSHTRLYRQTVMTPQSPLMPLVIACGGGSAVGLPRAQSRSGYGAHLRKVFAAVADAARKLHLRTPPCFAFGQVDIEFVYTFRRSQESRRDWDAADFEQFCDAAAAAYVGWVGALGLPDTVILGVNPPAITDAVIVSAYDLQMRSYQTSAVIDEGHAGDLRSGLTAMRFPDQRVRTANHRQFNAALARHAVPQGLRYDDNFDVLIDGTGCLARRFASSADEQEIHIEGRAALEAKAVLLRRIASATASGKAA